MLKGMSGGFHRVAVHTALPPELAGGRSANRSTLSHCANGSARMRVRSREAVGLLLGARLEALPRPVGFDAIPRDLVLIHDGGLVVDDSNHLRLRLGADCE